jgi:ribosome-associated heat shock protein Hsp15
MRIDKFLFFIRLVKTRGLAQKLLEDGHFRIDGRVVERAHAEVKVGNVLTFPLNDRVRVIKVEAMPTRRGPAPEAQACYTDLAQASSGGQGE